MANPAPGYKNHPNHKVVLSPPEYRVRLSLDGVLIADTRRALRVEEGGYPARYYIPADDFAEGVLIPTRSSTYCPFKGEASYWSVTAADKQIADAVWGYDQPYDECQALAGYRAFYAEHFEVDTPA